MLNISKKILTVLTVIYLSASSFGALSPSNPPFAVTAFGQTTTAVVACTLKCAGADGYNIILDGSAVGTSTITVAIQVQNPGTGIYLTPVTLGGVADPITLTNGTTQVINVPGGFAGIQVNVTSFGTATGTFRCLIHAY